MTLFETTILQQANLRATDPVAGAALGRDAIFRMSQAAEDAVLRPNETGTFEHDVRAALAARIARLSDDALLTEHYLAAAGGHAALADPAADNAAHELDPVLAFVDKVAHHTRDVAAEDVSSLQAAGVADADIVRLCELIAFVAYQIRVIAGLRLMQSTPA
ncbi:MAG: hypothetical protein AB8B62_15405 [Roseobacter sp.]